MPSLVAVTLKTKLSGPVDIYHYDEETKTNTLLTTNMAKDGKITFSTKQLGNLVLVQRTEKTGNVDGAVSLTNIEREKAGLSTLELDGKLMAAAAERAKETATSFSHTRPNGENYSSVLNEYNVTGLAWENIAAGVPTADAAIQMWMSSTAGHRENLLNSSIEKIGIGYYYDENTPFKHYWVFLGVK